MARYLFDKYFQVLVEKLNSTRDNLELEVRFGEVTYTEFERVKKFLESNYGQPTVIHTEDYTKNGNRQTVISNKNGTHTRIAIDKKELLRIQDPAIEVKISMASETSVPVTSIMEEPDLHRKKHRYSWTIPYIKFDITEVTQTLKGKATETKYEVELEMVSSLLEVGRPNPLTTENLVEFNTAFNKVSNQALQIRRIIQNTDLVYLSKDRNLLADYLNDKLKAIYYAKNIKKYYRPVEGEVYKEIPVQARNLKREDILTKGLFHNYSVTVKAEGVRKFLVIHSSGIWLMYPTSEFCKVANLPESWKPYIDTVLDGEDIPVEHRFTYKDIKHYYLPFDTLLFKGKDVTKEPLQTRLSYTKYIRSLDVVYTGKSVSLVMEEKPFYFFNNIDQFYTAVNRAVTNFDNRYVTDGLIFTPAKSEYNPQSNRYKLYQRVLNKYPDICKWKPHNKLSIDLKIYQTSTKRALYASGGSGLEEFVGVPGKYPFNPETQIDWLAPLIQEVPNDTILEFAPKTSNDGKFVFNSSGEYILTPLRPRGDKKFPNRFDIAMNVWEDINNPIELSTLKGEDLFLMRKYHNRIKRQLFNEVEEGSLLVDIGSGNGGDMNKWSKFSTVLAIEPSDKNLTELKRRLAGMDESDKNRIHLLQSGGEESEKILDKTRTVFNGKFLKNDKPVPLYISMMLSLSFFYKDKEMLEALATTISAIRELYVRTLSEIGISKEQIPEIKFIFLTIEGERTLETMKKYNNKIRFPGFYMDYYPEIKTVSIDIPGTIVENQKEYIVNLQELQQLLNVKDGYMYEAVEEEYLNRYEKEITAMYVYGSLTLFN